MKNFIFKNCNLICLIVLFAFILQTSCRTVTRSVEKERESVDSSFIKKKNIKLRNDSLATSEFYGFSEKELQQLFSRMNFKFSGNSNKDSAEIEIIQTKDGIKMKLSGMADAELETVKQTKTEKKDSTSAKIAHVQQAKSDASEVEENSKIDKSKVDKNTTQKTKGVQWNLTLILIIGVIVLIVCYFAYRYMKNNLGWFGGLSTTGKIPPFENPPPPPPEK